jgi:anthranilate synthase component 1
LFEGADSRAQENSFSFICFDELALFEVDKKELTTRVKGQGSHQRAIETKAELESAFGEFCKSFSVDYKGSAPNVSGFYGYCSYDSIELFEDIKLSGDHRKGSNIPMLSYRFFRYVIAIDHFRSELHLIEHRNIDCDENLADRERVEILRLVNSRAPRSYPFALNGERYSGMSDDQHRAMIESCKRHIYRGDVFQIVPSRWYAQGYMGDDFNVYRSLRSINPSPYLFYLDCTSFRLIGSSPEAQLIIKDGKATVYPIAGTYKRTGDERADLAAAEALAADPKESAEHVMLVDLARNDLSRHCTQVTVEAFKEIHFYSHVIHLVSKVTGKLNSGTNPLQVLGDTFPAGTLSGAPKYKAMELIDRYEAGRRGFYGGCAGFIGLNGDCNHCIIIRSILSVDNELILRAGGGVVADSVVESEIEEVHNKLGAVRVAIERTAERCHE